MLNHHSLVSLIWRSALIFTASGFAVVSGNSAFAQIQPDNTLGTQNSIVNDIDALNKRIDGGVKVDGNLFHSFEEFNVSEGGSVYFANPQGIIDIFSRVTGNNPSNIFGKLGVLGDANLFLINPNGIVFGENASLDVGGSFVATTTNGIQFGEQGVFSASNPETPRLLNVSPSALFFNAVNNQAGIQNNSVVPAGTDPAGFDAFGLRVADGKSLLLVGGNVSMDRGKVNAYGGRVELGGLAASGSINLLFDGDNLKLGFPENVTRADVSLTNQAFVRVEADGGGDIAINARNLDILKGSQLSAGIGEGLGTPDVVAGDIVLNATREIKVAGVGSNVRNAVRSGSQGNGGNITVDSGSFSLQNVAQLKASTSGIGNAGNIKVTAKNAISLVNIVGILSTVEAGGVGQGGNIDIDAATFSLTDAAGLRASTSGIGNAGNIKVTATEAVSLAGYPTVIFSGVEAGGEGQSGNIDINTATLSLAEGTEISASTSGIGNAGNIKVTARDAVSLVDGNILSTVEEGGVGKGGNIDINAAALSLTDSGQLITVTRGASNTQPAGQKDAGNVNVKVTGLVDIAGVKNGLSSGIFSFLGSGTKGKGGNITVDSGSVSLRNGGQLAASTRGIGDAGNIKVTARDAISLVDSNILSTVEAGGVGEGSNIDINAATLSLTDTAQILTITRSASNTQPAGQGNAGNVNVKVSGLVDIAGEKNGSYVGIFSVTGTGTKGNAGNITIDSGSLSLRDGAELGASTGGIGDAGNVHLIAKDAISLTGNTRISSTVDRGAQGNGGNITVDSGSFLLQNGTLLEASTYGVGNAGNVTLNTKNAVSLVGNVNIFSTVEAGGKGQGGNIDIKAATLSLTDGSQLISVVRGTSNTQPAGQGNAGNVNVKVSGLVDIAGEKNGIFSGIFSSVGTGTEKNGGDITIDSGSFSLRDGAQLISSTFGKGNAGDVKVTALDTNISDKSALFVNSLGLGNTGDIEVNSPKITLNGGKINASSVFSSGGNINLTSDLLLMRRGAEISTNAGIILQQGGDGGNININSKFIVALPQENSDITANAFSGAGGNVEILSQGIFGIEPRAQQTDKSDITASSELGVPGNLNLTDPDDSSIRNNLGELPENQIDTNVLIASSCIVRSNEESGTFLITGAGGLPQNPSDAPLSNYSTGSVRSIPTTSEKLPPSATQTWKIGDPIVEPSGAYQLPNGQIVLSRECSQ